MVKFEVAELEDWHKQYKNGSAVDLLWLILTEAASVVLFIAFDAWLNRKRK